MKKLKKWQFVLLIIFYPIGIVYFCVWIYNKNKAKNSKNTVTAKPDIVASQKINNTPAIAKNADELNSELAAIQKKLYGAKTRYESYCAANKSYIQSGETNLNVSLLNTFDPTVELSLNCMNVRQLKALYNQNKKLIKDCLTRYSEKYTTKTNAALYKLMTIALEAELQNILYNLRPGKLEDAQNSVRTITAKYMAIVIDGNQSIAPTLTKFVGEIEYLFLEAVKIEYEYYVQKERIIEEQRALREQMKQEAEERKKLEEERRQIEKEESKYHTEMQNIKEQIENTVDSEKASMLEARLAEIETQLNNVEQKKSEIIKLQNGKAGYVYIISNLGSFGDNVFKVGMTRRLEPMERVKELGDASVPFPFDVHSFIFSDNAVDLEHTLHVELNAHRVNKVNMRKEFFKIPLDEIEKIVYQHQPTAEFNRTMLAEQYRQSLSTDFIPEQLEELTDFDEEEDEY